MLQTEEAAYRVSGVQPTHLWFEVLHGQDAGIRVSIPRRHEEYDEDMRQTLSELSTGDVIRAVLVSPSHEAPNWRAKWIKVLDEPQLK